MDLILLSKNPDYRLSNIYYKFRFPFNNTLFNFLDFNKGGIYHFLLKGCKPRLPIEIWYLIFEFKFLLEKKDYINFLFSECLFNSRTKILAMQDIKNYNTPHKDYNTIRNFRKFISNWYIWIKKVSEVCDKNLKEVIKWENLYNSTNNKIDSFYSIIINYDSASCCQIHNTIMKIIMEDIMYFKNEYSEIDSLDEPPSCTIRESFHYYFLYFNDWIKFHKIRNKYDLLNFIQHYDTSKKYFNKYWVEKTNPGDDLPLWNMILHLRY